MVNPLTVVRDTVYGFVEDEALTRGAAIAFYTTTSIGPLLFIVIAITGVIYGQDAAKGAILSELGDTMGHDSASLLQNTIQTAAKYTSGFALLGIGILVVTVSGVMSETKHALNVIWKPCRPRSR
jgi:membrane protein